MCVMYALGHVRMCHFLSQGLSLNLQLTNQSWLAGQGAPEILLCLCCASAEITPEKGHTWLFTLV